jgi:hypothetical protein
VREGERENYASSRIIAKGCLNSRRNFIQIYQRYSNGKKREPKVVVAFFSNFFRREGERQGVGKEIKERMGYSPMSNSRPTSRITTFLLLEQIISIPKVVVTKLLLH